MTLNLRISALLILTLSFYGCAPKDTIVGDDSMPAKPAIEETATTESAGKYIELAALSSGVPRNQHLLKAAHLLNQQHQFVRAEQQLLAIDRSLLNRNEISEIQILMAEIEINRGNPRAALKLLSISSILPAEQQHRLMRLRAQAFLDAG